MHDLDRDNLRIPLWGAALLLTVRRLASGHPKVHRLVCAYPRGQMSSACLRKGASRDNSKSWQATAVPQEQILTAASCPARLNHA